MKITVFSYRYGQEILEHPSFAHAWREIESIVRDAPLLVWAGKSRNNAKLDVVQQLMNAYFDRRFVLDHTWEFHPLATGIEASQLTADFRKRFAGTTAGSLSVQAEVQFGNMARFYTAIFKFPTAYSQKLIQLGLSVVPMNTLAKRIDSNVVNYERAVRELPSAELSITLPIILIGIEPDANTPIVDVTQSKFRKIKQLAGSGNGDNLRRIVHAYCTGAAMSDVSARSDIGPSLPDLEGGDASEDAAG